MQARCRLPQVWHPSFTAVAVFFCAVLCGLAQAYRRYVSPARKAELKATWLKFTLHVKLKIIIGFCESTPIRTLSMLTHDSLRMHAFGH